MVARRFLLWICGAGLLVILVGLSALAVAAQAPRAGIPAFTEPTRLAVPPPAGASPSPTPTAECSPIYTYTVTTATFMAAVDLLPGSQCFHCLVPLTLPFPITLYGQTYTTATVASYGNVQLATADTSLLTCPPPFTQIGPALLPYWADNIDTSWDAPCMSAYREPCGVFSRLSGSAPDRTFTIEWRGVWAGSNQEVVRFELRLHENSDRFDFVYASGAQFGDYAAVGVQDGASHYTSFSCNAPGNFQNVQIAWTPLYPPCFPSPTATHPTSPTATGTPPMTPVASSTPTLYPSVTGTPVATLTTAPTSTRTPVNTAVATSTGIPPSVQPGATRTPAATTTPCTLPFTDVRPTDYFYSAVSYLYCHAVISGYADNTFRPFTDTSRGQMAKIAVLGFGIPIWTPVPAATPTFADVPRANPFFAYVETAAHAQIVSGYADGAFRPFATVTRGQLAKILVDAAHSVYQWPWLNPPSATFADVPRDSAFYTYVETAYCHGIISGYADGTFRLGANATRGQIAKIEYLALLNQPSCGTMPQSALSR